MNRTRTLVLILILSASRMAAHAADADLKILFPQNRTAFQTNEWIDISVLRNAPAAIPAATLTLTLAGVEDQSKITATFELPAVPGDGKTFAATEHYHINGWLLRPGKYAVEVGAHGASAKAEIDVASHIRKSEFKLINWGRAEGNEQLVQGEDSLGFNLFYGHYGKDDNANLIRAGVDYMSCCTMGGAHQMDIRSECDWSDPYVTKGGTVRVVREAMMDRMRPNVQGVHFYDEPGLTWEKDDAGVMTPHAVPAQHRAYEAAFGHPPIYFKKVDPNNPENVKAWDHWAHWKLGFMDSAWKEAQFGVSFVRSDFLSVNQSQYGCSAFTDGYYFNVDRSLPIISGHGGYHDYGPGYFNPSFTLEMARARDFVKPNWYLPCWYGNTTADEFRLEQYLSFMTNIQGMISPPDIEPAKNAGPRQGVVESNQLMAKLGPIFNHMPVTKPPVAILYSLSQAIHAQTKNMNDNYAHAIPHGRNLPLMYLAGKVLQNPFMFVLDEDIIDGTLANDHRAALLTSLDYLDPKVIAALEDFAAMGGLVLITADSTVEIKGATKLPVAPRMPDQEKIDELAKAKNYKDMAPFQTMGKWFQGAQNLANAIKNEFDKAGIKPVFECDQPGIAASRQASGDIEYLFAVNASWDEAEGKYLSMKAVTATISIPDDGRPVYDASTGTGLVKEFQKKDGKLTGIFRFGPGQIRVFARTKEEIRSPLISTPVVARTMTAEDSPIKVSFNVTVELKGGNVFGGPIPLKIVVQDPLHGDRFVLNRSTENGTVAVELPLAANDIAGKWAILAFNLLNTEGLDGLTPVSFDYHPPARFSAIAGATQRAVFASNDRQNAFRFARLYQDVTIVKGKSAFNDAAAERLIKILKPWNVNCKIMDIAEASKTRVLTEEEAKTWCGLGAGRSKPGEGGTNPKEAGFAVRGPVILFGNPEDNAIIKYLNDERFLPYKPTAGSFPGNGRGMVAWQHEGVGRGQQSLTLIAYDEAGMAEAVGSLYEAIAGMDPLTKWALPLKCEIVPAAKSMLRYKPVFKNPKVADRVEAIKIDGKTMTVYSHDGSENTLPEGAKAYTTKIVPPAEYAAAVKAATPAPSPEVQKLLKDNQRPDRIAKMAAVIGNWEVIAFWGGEINVRNKDGTKKITRNFYQDITAMAGVEKEIVFGFADGSIEIFGLGE